VDLTTSCDATCWLASRFRTKNGYCLEVLGSIIMLPLRPWVFVLGSWFWKSCISNVMEGLCPLFSETEYLGGVYDESDRDW